VLSVTRGESSAVFTIAAPKSVTGLAIGDSIAVNGVCLTATSITANSFTADVMVQTLNLTSLSELEVGSPVNLELAAQLDMRMGGHIVQGHVDGVAEVVALTPGEKWAQLDITVPKELMKYVVAQGSISLDGVSLTVGSLDDDSNGVSLWLIPETLANTNLSAKRAGAKVNVEVDILAKYVERLLKKGVAGGN
jgi:riboflavin synthase